MERNRERSDEKSRRVCKSVATLRGDKENSEGKRPGEIQDKQEHRSEGQADRPTLWTILSESEGKRRLVSQGGVTWMGVYLIVREYGEILEVVRGKMKDVEQIASEYGPGGSFIRLPKEIIEKIKNMR